LTVVTNLRRLAVLAAVFLIVADVTRIAGAAVPVQPKREAELNILRTPRYFWRAGLHGFIRSKTRTFRTNVTVTCTGGAKVGTKSHVFRCVLRYRRKTATVRYTALGRYAFRLQILHPRTV
jgi:hypothetical protein